MCGGGRGEEKENDKGREGEEYSGRDKVIPFGPPILQEASYDYMEKEGERTFLECLDQLEVANAKVDDVSTTTMVYMRCGLLEHKNDFPFTFFSFKSLRTDCNHIFLHFVPPIILDPHKVNTPLSPLLSLDVP